MRPDQLQKVEQLAEKVMDVFLVEADPQRWTGADMEPAKMTPDVRGARNWDMKNANQAGALAMRVLELKDRIEGLVASGGGDETDDRAEADIARFEKQAKKLLDTVSRRGTG